MLIRKNSGYYKLGGVHHPTRFFQYPTPSGAPLMSSSSYSIEKLHPFRQLVIDGMELASRNHSIHGLVEVDITQARVRLRFLITSILIDNNYLIILGVGVLVGRSHS